MASARENLFIYTPLNFKEGKLNSQEGKINSQEKSTGSESTEKYDPLLYCRTCASMDPYLVPIFKDEGLEHSLNRKIEKYLPIEISQNDDLPVHLCYHCASILIAWDNLAIGCIEAEKKLTLLRDSSREKELEGEVPKNIERIKDKSEEIGDEPLVNKNINANESTRDILQEKNDQTLEECQIQPLRRRRRRVSKRKARKISLYGNDNEARSEVIKHPPWCSCCEITPENIHHGVGDEEEGRDGVKHRCPVCRKTFEDALRFAEDLYSHLSDDLIGGSDAWEQEICKVCRTKYDLTEKLTRHIIFHLDEKVLKENSKKVFVKKKKKKRVPKKTLICDACGKMFARKYALKRHLGTHSKEKKFTCEYCGKQYSQESGLLRHLQVIHEGVRKYKCPICSEVFNSNEELKSHQDTHPDPRPFQCDECGRTFISQKHFYHHWKYHHRPNGMRQLCTLCDRYFSSPSVLKRHHKVIHLGLKEFQCHICSTQLTTKHYLQEHLRLHSDERPEVCSHCGKTFQVAGNLKQHLKTHMGKTQICYVCGKGFTRRCHLRVHMKCHKEVEHPRCQFCEKTFVLKIDLEKHLKKDHSGKLEKMAKEGAKVKENAIPAS